MYRVEHDESAENTYRHASHGLNMFLQKDENVRLDLKGALHNLKRMKMSGYVLMVHYMI